MRTSIAFLFFLHISFRLISQVTISGDVLNAPKDAQVEIVYTNNFVEWEEVSAGKAMLDHKGHFSLKPDWKKAGPAKLTIGEQYTNIFLVPGADINITLDYNDFDKTVTYSGKGSADNNYLAADLLADFNGKAYVSASFNDANKFKAYIDSLENANQLFLKSHDSPDLSPEFRSFMITTIKYRFVNPRWMFKIGFDKVSKKFVERPVPSDYFDFLKTISMNEQGSIDNVEYSMAVMRALYELHDSKVVIPDSLSDDEKTAIRIKNYYEYRKTVFKGDLLDLELTKLMKDYIGLVAGNKKLATELMNDYKANCKNPEYIDIINKAYAKATMLSAGNPAPDFALVDMNGKSVSLSSLKGKVVFIDFWATWCKPCIAEMPVTHKLMEKFKDRADVVFMNVNVDDNKEKWKNFVDKEKMSGTNLHADKKQSDDLHKSYNFNGIPHFVIIDKQGKLIDVNSENGEKAEKNISEAIK